MKEMTYEANCSVPLYEMKKNKLKNPLKQLDLDLPYF